MFIDVHAHAMMGVYRGDPRGNEKKLLRAMEKYGIDKIYVSNLGGTNPDEEVVRIANSYTERFVKENPGRVEGYVYVSPEHKNALDVLKRGIEEQGMSGVKLWVSTFCDDPCVYPLAEKMIEYGIPLLIHSFWKAKLELPTETTGVNVANLAKRYPELKIIMAHLGGNCYDGIPAICDYKNVWVDMSSSIFRADDIDYTVERLGAERVLLGSDMIGTYLTNVGQILEADLTDEERELIFSKNAIKVFDTSFKL